MTSFRRATVAALAACAVMTAWTSCRREEPAAARLTVEPAFLHLAYPRWADVTLSFEILRDARPAPGAPAPIVFVHLLDAQGDVVRTFDHAFPGSLASGATTSYALALHQSALSPPLAPGEYRLTVGMVDADGRRWPMSGEAAARREYLVARVDVPAADDAEPLFSFSKEFFDSEPGNDVQVPAIRWFDGEARVRIAEVAGSGSILVGLQIPPPNARGYAMELETGSTEARLFLSSPCSETQTQISGPGRRLVRLPLSAAPAGQPCEIRLASNYRLRPLEPGGRSRVAVLETLSWAAQ